MSSRPNEHIPEEARRPDDPAEGVRVDTGRNDRQTKDRVTRTRGDVFIVEIWAPNNLNPLTDPDINKFRDNMGIEIASSRVFISTYQAIQARGPNFVRPGSDYETKVKDKITDKIGDIKDFFNEDERLFNKRSIVGP